jgi:hypothetical protein
MQRNEPDYWQTGNTAATDCNASGEINQILLF